MHTFRFLVLIVFWFVFKISSEDENITLVTNNSTSRNENEKEFELSKLQKKCLNNEQYVLSVTSESSVNSRKRHINENLLNYPRSDQKSLVIVFDATGSMQDSLNVLRNSARNIIDKFSSWNHSPIYNYIFVPFRDPETGPAVVSIDSSKLLKTLDKLKVFGGDACPKNTLSGISLALKYALPKSFVYVFTDATAHYYNLEKTVIEQIQQKQATITFLITDDCNQSNSSGYRTFENLSKNSNGKTYRIKTNEIDQVLSHIDDKLDQRNSLLASVYSPNPGSNMFNVSIDKNVIEFTVDVTGSRSRITITDPKNEIYRNSINKLNLERVKMVKVMKPISGKWQIDIKARSPDSISLSAISDIIYDFGFSQSLPKSITETSYTPVLDIENRLIIKPSKDVNLTASQIEILNDKDVKTSVSILELRRINQTEVNEILYVTQPFLPSNEPFQIIVNGFDEDGNEIRRILSSVLRARSGKGPGVFIPQTEISLMEGETLIIKCHIDSLTATQISMMLNTEQLREWKSDQSISIEYKVESTSTEHEGIYKCIASNSYGTSERSLEIKVLSRPFTEYKFIENQSNVTIPCNLSPKLKLERLSLKWFFGESEIIPDNKVYKTENMSLIIPKLAKELAGWYICKMVSDNVVSEAVIYIKVLYAPIVREPLFEEAFLAYGESLNIGCTIESDPISNIQWKFRQKNEEEFVNYERNPFPLKSFSDRHEGLYICEAKNDIDSIERLIKVKGLATRKPEIIKIYSMSIIASVGDDLKLKCRCEMCEPITEFMWIHENVETKQSISLIGKHMKGNWSNQADLSLTLNNLTINDAGIYKCIIANKFGSDLNGISVIIKQPPAIPVLGANKNGNAFRSNEKIISNCRLHNIFNSTIVSDDTEAAIIIRPTRVYTCRAKDALGASVKNYSILLIDDYELNEIGVIISSDTNTNFTSCKLNKLKTPDITKLFIGSHNDSNNSYGFKLNNITESIYECRQRFTLDSELLTLVLFGLFDLYSHERNRTAEIVSKQIPMVVCSKVLKALDSKESLATQTELLQNSYSCEWFSLNGPINVFNFIANDPPEITSNLPVKLSLIRGENATMSCFGVGNPAPRNYWVDENTTTFSVEYQLNTENELFKNKNLTCMSENTIGIDAHSVIVHVTDIPEETRNLTEKFYDNVLIGANFSLVCPFRHFDRIQWFKDGIKMRVQNGSLDFMNISFKDNGTYSCHVTNAAGRRHYEQTVFINFPPKVVLEYETELANASTIDVVSLNQFSVKCNVVGYPIPRTIWTHNGNLASTKNSLTIGNVSTFNAGEYVCTAKNEHGSDQMTFELNVQFAPILTMDSDQILDSNQNESIELNCSMEANPPAEYTWLKDGLVIFDKKCSTLEIKQVDLKDTGSYKCIANNDFGNVAVKFTVIVNVAATIIYISENTTITNSTKLILTCEAIGNPMPILVWRQDFKKILTTEDNHYQSEAENSIYFIDNKGNWTKNKISDTAIICAKITYDTAYKVKMSLHCIKTHKNLEKHSCFAINALGQDNRMVSIETMSAPKFKNHYQTLIEVLDGFPVTIICDVDAYPKPTIIWQKENQTIDTSSISRHYGTSHNGKRLYIHSADRNDGGFYSCFAQNTYGSDEHLFHLDVLIPPYLNTSAITQLESVYVFTGETIDLNCPIKGNPLPLIYWIEPDRIADSEILFHNSTLHLDSVQESKTIRCYANNTLGELEYTFEIIIKKPPTIIGPITENKIVHVNDNILLDCGVSAETDANITWYKDDIQLTLGNQPYGIIAERTFLSSEHRYLRVFRLKLQLFGNYSCLAANSFGSVRKDLIVVFEPYFGEWIAWSVCSKKCNQGTKTRERYCHKMNRYLIGIECKGERIQTSPCFIKPCDSFEWEKWSVCSVTTGIGQQYRLLKCVQGTCDIKVKKTQIRSCKASDQIY